MNTMQILHPSFTMIPFPLPSALHLLALTRISIPSLILVRDPILVGKERKQFTRQIDFHFHFFQHEFSPSQFQKEVNLM